MKLELDEDMRGYRPRHVTSPVARQRASDGYRIRCHILNLMKRFLRKNDNVSPNRIHMTKQQASVLMTHCRDESPREVWTFDRLAKTGVFGLPVTIGRTLRVSRDDLP